MHSEPEGFLAKVQEKIMQRVNQQIERHYRVDPNCDSRQIIDLQIGQERQKLEGLLDKEEDATRAQVLQALIHDYLPELAQKLKRR